MPQPVLFSQSYDILNFDIFYQLIQSPPIYRLAFLNQLVASPILRSAFFL